MDNRIANDMISSGMIPSGEKNKEDLSRTQYGSAPSPSKLMDAYKSMYDKKEEVINEHHQKDKDGNTIPHEDEEITRSEEYISELSPATLGRYVKKSKNELAISAMKGDADKALKRITGINRATDKLVKQIPQEDKKEMKEGLGAAVKMGLKAVTKIAKSDTAKKLTKDMARGAATQLGANMVSGGSGGQQKQNTAGKVSAGSYQAASADLFDIVKGQLLDEGLSEEEIRDIMLTLTPDEILNEISAETALAASKARDVQAGKLKGPENTEKRAELRAKASQNYDRAVEKRKSGFVKNTASPQGPSRIPTGEA